MAEAQDKPRQACDNCRFRKVRCDRGQPCRNCSSGSMRCEYLHAVRRKGPRCGQGRRQWQIRRGLPCNESSMDVFRISTATEQPSLDSLVHNSAGSVSSSDEQHSSDPTDAGWSWPVDARAATPAGLDTAAPRSHVLEIPRVPLDNLEVDMAGQSKRLSESLAAHVQIFLKYLFPIMPIVDDEFVADALRIDDLPPARYAAIIAICAATRIQLRMDNSRNGIGEGPDAGIPLEPQLTGEMLLSLTENALRQHSVIDDSGLDSILASFFLFASYGNLNNARFAWFYLNQAISLAQSLDITSESGYHDLDEAEQQKRRRVFWVLFVTERTFALQHRRGVRLQSTIAKPQIIDSEYPVVMNDFVNHIQVFEQLPPSLYVWQSQGDNNQLSLTHTINDKLCTVQPEQSVIESQRLDTLLTQQWLRVSMWRLAFGKKPSSFCSRGALLPFNLPIDAGKLIMGALGNVGSKSRDCHGIGFEQKLFDVGISLADTSRVSTWGSSLDVGPKELLSCIVKTLSQARGCPSHLLPNLLKHSEDIFRLGDPYSIVNTPWHIPQTSNGHRESPVVEELPTEHCPMGWSMEQDMELSNLETSNLSRLCEDPTLFATGFGNAEFA